MQVIESHLQSKVSAVPDDGGEDRIVVTEHYAAVIDGTMAKTNSQHLWNGVYRSPGYICADILVQAVEEMSPDLSAEDASAFLNGKIMQAYQERGILEDMKMYPVERYSAIMALYNNKRKYVMLGGECQAVVGDKHYQILKKTDIINSQARSQEIHRLISQGKLTEEELLAMDIDSDPGRKLILDPPHNAAFPGLRGQARYQNNLNSPYGFFIMDGFADPRVHGFCAVEVPAYATQVILATRGYVVPQGTDPADALYSLNSAEFHLKNTIANDPCAYKLYQNTKGKGKDQAFDDRAYVRVKL